MQRRAFTFAAAAALGLRPAFAQEAKWPTRPVTLIVPFSPGGPTDTMARLLAERLQEQWKIPVLVDHKPGGGTVIGTQQVARAPADGYTLGLAITAHVINPSVQTNLPYDTRRDLAAVSLLSRWSLGFFANPKLPVNNMRELIDYAKRNPGKLSYATPGNGTAMHLAGELLKHTAGIDMVHIPYRGSAPAQQDTIGGQVPLLIDIQFSAMPFVTSGGLKLLALADPVRSPALPDVPVVAETVKDYSASSFVGLIAPLGVPSSLVHRISRDAAAALKTPELTARMAQLGMQPVGSTPEAFDQFIGTEIRKWGDLVKATGIRID